MNHHLLARTYSCMGEYRAAINSEKETLGIFEAAVSDRDMLSNTA